MPLWGPGLALPTPRAAAKTAILDARRCRGYASHGSQPLPLFESLTKRETEILACLAEGLSNQAIADRLFLSVKTVRWYNSQIYSKLGVNNREAALDAADRFGLLTDASDALKPALAEHNLPRQTTPFVGRRSELIEIARLLDEPDTRLITILAPGGMGKTRLVLAAAEQQSRAFPDGVFFVGLAPLRSADAILTAIASAAGFNFYAAENPEQQLLDFLSERQMLLALDNFEHLLDGATLVNAILRAAPQVRVLATSREKLNLSGETIYALSGLDFPTWETPEDALEYDAVRLFMQSARRVRPDFELRADHLDYLSRICRLTAGMPLALVLAAGWVDALSLEQIAGELQQGIDILETELRDVPERQRSVRASFNYTWERLSDAERDVFIRLSVFKGGFTVEAAQAIAGANARHLRKLVDRALVQILPTGRYDIHELMRQYASGHLRDAGEYDHMKTAHCHYYLELLREHETIIKSPRQLESLAAIYADHENIYAAWRYGVEQGEAEAIRQAAETLTTYVLVQSTQQIEAERLLRAARERFDVERYPRVWARVTLYHILLTHRGVLASRAPVRDELERCLAIAGEHGDRAEVGQAKKLLGTENYWTNPLDPAGRQLIREYLAIFEALDDPFYISNAHKWLGFMFADRQTKMAHYEDSLAVARAARLPLQVASTLSPILHLYVLQGRYPEAAQVGEECLAHLIAQGDTRLQAFSEFWLSLVEFFMGHLADARAMAEHMLRLLRRLGEPHQKIFRFNTLGLFETAIHDPPWTSAEWVEEADRVSTWFGAAVAILGSVRAFERYALNEPQAAWPVALRTARGIAYGDFLPMRIAALTVIAMLVADEGDPVRGVELLSLALNHPASPRGWLDNLSPLTRRHDQLREEIAPDEYDAAWARGAQLDLEDTIAHLLEEFADRLD
jgi:predicted ATPase/DNA-binding CsgD family transcriptional regulator